MGRSVHAAVAVLLVVSLPAALHGRTDQPGLVAPIDAPRFVSGVDLVRLNVAVTDARGRPVVGLAREDFVVRDEGAVQAVEIFRPDAVPLDVSLLIDSSASLRSQELLVRSAATSFVQTLRPGDRAQVLSFSTTVRLLQAWTADVSLLEQAIHLVAADGDTALYQALYVTLRGFERSPDEDGVPRRRAIVLLTDGEDSKSLVGFDQVLDAARRADIAIYAIALRLSEAALIVRTPARVQADEFRLRQLARETGGRCFPLQDLSELGSIYGAIGEELASQYLLAYVPASVDSPSTPGRAPGFRRVTVNLPRHGGVSVRTRSGYFAGTPDPRVALVQTGQ